MKQGAILLVILIISSCNDPGSEKTGSTTVYPDSLKLFKQLDSAVTGIDFRNNIVEDQYTNPIVYEYTYNGGGVAIGDVNNDGRDDIFFTANQNPNRLYLNKGNFRFEDITDVSGSGGKPGCWKTGATMTDVNADGLLDIYVCYSGDLPACLQGVSSLSGRQPMKQPPPVIMAVSILWMPTGTDCSRAKGLENMCCRILNF